jgi:hypothetical protein
MMRCITCGERGALLGIQRREEALADRTDAFLDRVDGTTQALTAAKQRLGMAGFRARKRFRNKRAATTIRRRHGAVRSARVN